MRELFIVLAILAVIVLVVVLLRRVKKPKNPRNREKDSGLNSDDVATLAAYVNAQKEQAEAQKQLKELKKAELKQKLEAYKQTKDELKLKLKRQLDGKNWKNLSEALRSSDKGGMGIYVLYNASNGKYYVGQAKQLYKRIRAHFAVEDIARDFLKGDDIRFKVLTASEIDADYRIDHIERTGIELFDADKSGYNKTTGNL